MGEFELLARMRERLPYPGPKVRLGSGDDAAITVPGGATVTSVDAIVEGVHFRRDHFTPEQIGRKALSAALSDLAAMGAEAGEAYVALGLPDGFGEDECLELLDGLADVATATGTTLAGGDVTRAPALSVTVTVVGHAPVPEALVPRDGALQGDRLVLTGELGGAAAGLLLLEHPELASGLPPETAEALRSRQLEPVPRLRAGRTLASGEAGAMIDVSDGLGGDARHLAEGGNVGLLIEAAALPVAAGVAEVAAAAGEDPLRLAISGGEDYELLAAMPAQGPDLGELALRAGVPMTEIGAVIAGEGVEIRLPDGRLLQPAGYDQLG